MARYYDRATLGDLAAMLALDDTPDVRDLERAAITGAGVSGGRSAAVAASPARAAFGAGAIYLADCWYSDPVLVTCSPAKRAALLAAIAHDVAAQPARERYFPSSAPLGVVMFSQDGQHDAASFAYGLDDSLVYVTRDMTTTVAFLKANGLYGAFRFRGRVTSLSFQRYDPYAGLNHVTQPASPYFLGTAHPMPTTSGRRKTLDCA